MAAAGEQHRQVGTHWRALFTSRCRAQLFLTSGDTDVTLRRKFLLTKPMHMAAEDSGVCQLHCISEDSVSSGHGASSGVCVRGEEA